MRFGWLMATTAALWAMPAQAVTMYATLTGTLTEQTDGGIQSPIAVGDKITLTAHFDSADVFDWGDTGYQIVGFPRTGDAFKLALNDYQWIAGDEEFGAGPFYTYDNYPTETRYARLPALVLKDGKVAGVMGKLLPAFSPVPVFNPLSYTGYGYLRCRPDGCTSHFDPLNLSDTFTITKEYLTYGNSYQGPNFIGVWDFSQSIIGVPEPASWALLMLGVGMIGIGLRRRQGTTSPMFQHPTVPLPVLGGSSAPS